MTLSAGSKRSKRTNERQEHEKIHHRNADRLGGHHQHRRPDALGLRLCASGGFPTRQLICNPHKTTIQKIMNVKKYVMMALLALLAISATVVAVRHASASAQVAAYPGGG